MKKADIIIPHHNRHDHLKNCLDNIDNSVFNIIVVSGGSFAKNCNKGAKLAETEDLIFLNDDVVASNKVFHLLANAPEDFVGVTEFIPQQASYFYGIGFNGRFFKTTRRHETIFPCGYFFKIKCKVWEELEGFDERFRNGGEDGDLGLKIVSGGYSVGWIDEPATHYHSQSEGRLRYSKENQEILDSKWDIDEIKKLFKRDRKILIATNHLDRIGGTETFTYTLTKELSRRGFDVDVFTLLKGIMSDKIEEFANVVTKPKDDYDLILINHTTCLEKLKDLSGVKVFTSHGVCHDIEKAKEGADYYVAISEEVADTMKSADVIRNGVDCERFKPENPPKRHAKRVLSMCQGNEARDKVKTACDELGLEFDWVERDVFDVENKIKEADIVVTLGRGAMESMASGKAVFVYDSRNYMGERGEGMITKENWKEFASHNFSGRARNITYSIEDIKENFKLYSPEMCEDNREIALENFNVIKQANKYLSYE